MQRERRSLWIIIVVLFCVGLFQFLGWQRYLGIGSWNANRTIGWGWDVEYALFMWLVASPGTCALISALVYAWLHYRHRHLTLWLMALQMIILFLVFYFPVGASAFVIVAWLILFAIILRSWKAPVAATRKDILDDI